MEFTLLIETLKNKDFWIGFLALLSSIAAFTASIGFLKFKKFFPKLHAISVNDTLGVIFVAFALILMVGISFDAAKTALLAIFALFSGSVVTYAIAKSAFMDNEHEKGE